MHATLVTKVAKLNVRVLVFERSDGEWLRLQAGFSLYEALNPGDTVSTEPVPGAIKLVRDKDRSDGWHIAGAQCVPIPSDIAKPWLICNIGLRCLLPGIEDTLWYKRTEV